MGLWLADQPLVLASRSESRRAVLAGAGIPLEVLAADIDERAIEAQAGAASPSEVALLLARHKALAVTAKRPGRLVLGADQTLALGQRLYAKPADLAAARDQLAACAGAPMSFIPPWWWRATAPCCSSIARSPASPCGTFSDGFLDRYLAAAGAAVTASVGGYQVESLGIQLFERIEGDHFTILGLPLLRLLQYLRHAALPRRLIGGSRGVHKREAGKQSGDPRWRSLWCGHVHSRPDRLARDGKIDHRGLLRGSRRAGPRCRCGRAPALRRRGRSRDRGGISGHHRGRQGRPRQAGGPGRRPSGSLAAARGHRASAGARRRDAFPGRGAGARRRRWWCSTFRSSWRPPATSGSMPSWWCRRRATPNGSGCWRGPA